MHGTLKLPLGKNKFFTVYGGPYLFRPETMVGVKMAAEMYESCDINIPTPDFSIPRVETFGRGLDLVVDRILKGEPVYVGCRGGFGRTGIMLAVLAKAFGEEHPVEYVRGTYHSRAVETLRQREFVTQFPISARIRRKIALYRIKNLFRKGNLTQEIPLVFPNLYY